MIKIAYCILFFCLFAVDVFAVESNDNANYISIIENNQKIIAENQKQIEKIKQNNNDKIAENNKLINNNETGITSNSNIDNLNFEEQDKFVKEKLEKERILDEKQLQQRRDGLLFGHLNIAPYAMFNTKFKDLSLGIQLMYLAEITQYYAGFSIWFDYYNIINNRYMDIPSHRKDNVVGEGYRRVYSLIFTITALGYSTTLNNRSLNFGFHMGMGWQRFKIDGVNQYLTYNHSYYDMIAIRIAIDIGYSRLFLRMIVDISQTPVFDNSTVSYKPPKHTSGITTGFNPKYVVADFSIGLGFYLF